MLLDWASGVMSYGTFMGCSIMGFCQPSQITSRTIHDRQQSTVNLKPRSQRGTITFSWGRKLHKLHEVKTNVHKMSSTRDTFHLTVPLFHSCDSELSFVHMRGLASIRTG
jgi:hypothetical protein